MPLPKTESVTAQDITMAIVGCDHQGFYMVCDLTKRTFLDVSCYTKDLNFALDALISRARQEARREALKEMDDAYRTLLEDARSYRLSDLRTEYNQP
jgi:hypothetical protein